MIAFYLSCRASSQHISELSGQHSGGSDNHSGPPHHCVSLRVLKSQPLDVRSAGLSFSLTYLQASMSDFSVSPLLIFRWNNSMVPFSWSNLIPSQSPSSNKSSQHSATPFGSHKPISQQCRRPVAPNVGSLWAPQGPPGISHPTKKLWPLRYVRFSEKHKWRRRRCWNRKTHAGCSFQQQIHHRWLSWADDNLWDGEDLRSLSWTALLSLQGVPRPNRV